MGSLFCMTFTPVNWIFLHISPLELKFIFTITPPSLQEAGGTVRATLYVRKLKVVILQRWKLLIPPWFSMPCISTNITKYGVLLSL